MGRLHREVPGHWEGDLVRELGPLLAVEGIDVDNIDVSDIDVPDMATLNRALGRAV